MVEGRVVVRTLFDACARRTWRHVHDGNLNRESTSIAPVLSYLENILIVSPSNRWSRYTIPSTRWQSTRSQLARIMLDGTFYFTHHHIFSGQDRARRRLRAISLNARRRRQNESVHRPLVPPWQQRIPIHIQHASLASHHQYHHQYQCSPNHVQEIQNTAMGGT